MTPIDNDALNNALANFKVRNPDQPRRGRKPVREDIYISDSLKKIKDMESRLTNEKGTLTAKERDELRNKASALRSRVNRKLEHRKFQNKLELFQTQFCSLATILTDEMDEATRDRIMDRLAALPTPQP